MEDRIPILYLLVKAARERNKKIALVGTDCHLFLCKDVVFASGTGATFNHLINIKEASEIIDSGFNVAYENKQSDVVVSNLIKKAMDASDKYIINIRLSGNKEVTLYE